ncbi:MAG: extracellular solute-binding protein [Clostridiales bacterium]|nr:extracellular solute-binding protein [Clostridiales bacterium]
MKKNILTKAATVAVALLIVSGLSACGSSKKSVALQENGKPESISIMATTILTENNGHAEFCKAYEDLTGIKLTIEKPEHNQYYEKVGITFAAEEPADVIELGSTYYPSYAAEGVLWDMTDAWESSDLYANSDVVSEKTLKYVNGMRTDGDVVSAETEEEKDAVKDRIYGFPNQRGGGTVTYARKDWMDALGIDVPTSYEEFYDMLKAFKTIGESEAKDSNGVTFKEKYKGQTIYPLTISGLISTESPYEIYLREFYQDARPDIHYDKDKGKYVDGVLTEEMKAGLQRIEDAWNDGLIDPQAISNKTSTCRDKFQSGIVGCFNYWAGTWNRTLDKNLKQKDPTAEMIALPSFDVAKEYYIERPAIAYVITNFCEHPEEVFENFILYSHDGGEGQLLFTHGVEDVHYTVDERDASGNVTKATALPTMADAQTTFEKSFYDAALSITEFDDPFELDERIVTSLAVFDEYSELYDLPVMDSTVAEQLPDVETAKQQLLSNIVIEKMSVEEALAVYASDTERQRKVIMETLNGEYDEAEDAANIAALTGSGSSASEDEE